MRVPRNKIEKMEFSELLTAYSTETETLCVDSDGNIVANHALGFLSTRPVTDYGKREVAEYTSRTNDLFVRFAKEAKNG